MLSAVASVIVPPGPFAASLLVEFGKLIVPVAVANRTLFVARVTVPANVTLPKGEAAEAIVKEIESALEG